MSTLTAPALDRRTRFAAEVRSGLCRDGQKELPSKYLYSDVGSALFEAISVLPEYGLTRADERLLRRHGREIVQRLPKPVVVSELGSGSGKKARPLLEALCHSQEVAYYPIEISAAALTMTERELGDLHCVNIIGLESEYLAGLSEVAAQRREDEHLFVLFLGSTIGNFDPGADLRFLRNVRQRLAPGDSLLLGADLIKSRQQLMDAYDDPAGVTAAFNRNLLARINRELDADFDLRAFEHEARFNEETSSVEMHLRSLKRQVVKVRGAGFQAIFEAGETIWTESSHKYSLPELTALATSAGFRLSAQWIDREWPFTENLLVAV
jgi:dimethylhistidine N-methyltransferase